MSMTSQDEKLNDKLLAVLEKVKAKTNNGQDLLSNLYIDQSYLKQF